MKKWDVVLLKFPFTDLQSSKVRPAIVISPNSYHQTGQDGVFILVTSNTDRRSPYDVIVAQDHEEFVCAGFKKESAIRADKIMVLNKNTVTKTIGKIGPKLSLEIEAKLREFLQLPPYQPPLASK